ncbi:hypothetical protein L1987_44544 [Smallanthus sonchifolius]|uniref:Uncharacterized protein n=1 Tax=Smallanthus sonchifolius TaxID=185202 RepID=A0ACB9GQY3_9ASTR|nr:hypothetical protein L1987_44544 [Smallanthus sonchifolius]
MASKTLHFSYSSILMDVSSSYLLHISRHLLHVSQKPVLKASVSNALMFGMLFASDAKYPSLLLMLCRFYSGNQSFGHTQSSKRRRRWSYDHSTEYSKRKRRILLPKSLGWDSAIFSSAMSFFMELVDCIQFRLQDPLCASLLLLTVLQEQVVFIDNGLNWKNKSACNLYFVVNRIVMAKFIEWLRRKQWFLLGSLTLQSSNKAPSTLQMASPDWSCSRNKDLEPGLDVDESIYSNVISYDDFCVSG